MRYITVFVLSLTLIALAGCASQLHGAYSHSFANDCRHAESVGDFESAVVACGKAVSYAKQADSSPETLSPSLYNYGRVLRRSNRVSEAIIVQQEALAMESGLSGKYSKTTGRRLAELGFSYLEISNVEKGSDYVDRLITMADQYDDTERMMIAALFYFYSEGFQKLGNKTKSKRYLSKMQDLGYAGTDFSELHNG